MPCREEPQKRGQQAGIFFAGIRRNKFSFANGLDRTVQCDADQPCSVASFGWWLIYGCQAVYLRRSVPWRRLVHRDNHFCHGRPPCKLPALVP